MSVYSPRRATASKNSTHSQFDELIGQTFPGVLANRDPELERYAGQIADAGVLAVLGILLEVQQRLGGGAWLKNRMATYASLSPDQVKALGADKLPQQRAAHRVRAGT